MIVFLDFEASSLARRSFPVEIAWVFETGEAESHLIRPAADWTDWDREAERIHGIDRATLERDGRPPERLARRMLEVLEPHALFASAPSWDGKWLSVLLRGGGLPRHALRLADTEEARGAAVARHLGPERAAEAQAILHAVERMGREAVPEHRALPDARRERALWLEAGRRAEAAARNEL
ncbi:transcriptional regulator [Aureimonas flava]|uniref:Transcriptional regulator n=1 Tax=Aureimonas flava TaxID=2320271 RepID=A0A3A1WJY5_9HYPH|nr:transcriptional regulator [Aureimonas flava]RIX99190.1 transcriptional regulator [Aureimonas flava]